MMMMMVIHASVSCSPSGVGKACGKEGWALAPHGHGKPWRSGLSEGLQRGSRSAPPTLRQQEQTWQRSGQGSPGWEGLGERQGSSCRGEKSLFKRINQAWSLLLALLRAPCVTVFPSPPCASVSPPALLASLLGDIGTLDPGQGGGRWLEWSPVRGLCPQGHPGALLSCRSCGHSLVTAGWDKHGGARGGGVCTGRAKGWGTASPEDMPGGLAPVVPTLAWARGHTGPPCCSPDPSKVCVGCCGPLSCALGDRDTGLSPVTPKRIALAGAVGGCGRAPPPAGTGCRRR